MNEDRLFSTKDMAAFLGITDSALRVRIARKTVPEPFRMGGRLYWRLSEVEAWLDSIRKEKK